MEAEDEEKQFCLPTKKEEECGTCSSAGSNGRRCASFCTIEGKWDQREGGGGRDRGKKTSLNQDLHIKELWRVYSFCDLQTSVLRTTPVILSREGIWFRDISQQA